MEQLSEEEVGEQDTQEDLDYMMSLAGTSDIKVPKINKTISTSITNILTHGLNNQSRDIVREKYITPENCDRLKVVPCNETIFKGISKQSRITDSHLENV